MSSYSDLYNTTSFNGDTFSVSDGYVTNTLYSTSLSPYSAINYVKNMEILIWPAIIQPQV